METAEEERGYWLRERSFSRFKPAYQDLNDEQQAWTVKQLAW